MTGTVDKATVNTELGKTETLTVTVTGANGFAGPVSVTPSVVDATGTAVTGWTLTPTPASVDLNTDGTAQVTLTVQVPTDDAVLDPTIKLALASTAAPAEVASAFTVANQLTVNLDTSGTAVPHSGWPAKNLIYKVHLGAKVIFHNADSISHEIHADGGIPHEGGALAAGSNYTTTPTDSATWYCHLHESSAQARMVQVIP